MRRRSTTVLLLTPLALAAVAGPARAAVATSFVGGTITVTGDAQPNTVVVQTGLDPARVVVDVGADGANELDVARADVTQVLVTGGDGADLLQIDPGGATPIPVAVDGGPGADTITTGPGADAVHGGSGDDLLRGARGNDLLFGDAGADRVTWAPGDGSDVVEGGTGPDTEAFDGANVFERVDLSLDGPRLRLFRDVGNVLISMRSVDRVELRLLGGGDQLTVGTGVGAATALDADLGAGADLATGGDGADRIDGGDDADTLAGGGGGDLLLGGAGDDSLDGQDGDDGLDGGAGANTVTGGAGSDGCVNGPVFATCESAVLPAAPPRFLLGFEPDTPPETRTVEVPGPVVTVPGPVVVDRLPGETVEREPAAPVLRRVSATGRGLAVVVANRATVAQTVEVGARERLGRRSYVYAAVTRRVPAGRTATVALRAPAALRRALAAKLRTSRRLTRRPTVTARAIGGSATAAPTLHVSRPRG